MLRWTTTRSRSGSLTPQHRHVALPSALRVSASPNFHTANPCQKAATATATTTTAKLQLPSSFPATRSPTMPQEVSDIKQFIEICRRKDASCKIPLAGHLHLAILNLVREASGDVVVMKG